MQTPSNRIEWAIRLAQMGFKIIPIRAGTKEPVSGSWLASMTSKPEKIHKWAEEYPNCNFGVVPLENFVVIDLDQKDGKTGIDDFYLLEGNQDFAEGVTGQTFTVKTPSNGLHLYLTVSSPVGNASAFDSKGIDVRGYHGYVLSPLSQTKEDLATKTYEGTYEVECDADIKAAPAWIVSRLKSERARDVKAAKPLFELDLPNCVERAEAFLKVREPAIEGQNGNDHTYATAVQVKDLGISQDKCLAMLLEHWNDRCAPPWDEAELKRVVENAYAYGKSRPGDKGGAIIDVVDAFVRRKSEEAGETFEEDQDVSKLDWRTLKEERQKADQEEAFHQLRSITFRGDEIVKRPVSRESIIPEFMLAHGVGLLRARRGAGKTTILTDLALRLACDMDWHDIQAARGWGVVYICGEDDEGAQVQIEAWQKQHKIKPEKDRFIFMAGIMDLLDAASAKFWGEWIKLQLEGRRAVIVADTWQRATFKGSQNDDTLMATAVENLEMMADMVRGPAVAAVHPPKHDGNVTMGSSVIENTSSFIWVVDAKNEGRKLTVDRIKGKGTYNTALFEFKEFHLGRKDQFGKEVTAVLPVKQGGTGVAPSEESIRVAGTVRELYAHMIRDLMLEAENDPEYQKAREAHFSVRDTARRILERISARPSDPVVRALIQTGEIFPSERSTVERLAALFVSNTDPVNVGENIGDLVTEQGRKNSKRFRLVAFSKKMAPD